MTTMEARKKASAKAPPSVRDEVHELKAQVQQFKELAARSQADLQNAKARMERDRDQLKTYILEDVLRRLLPLADHMDRATSHLSADVGNHEWVRGALKTFEEFHQTLAALGVRKTGVVGEIFDAGKHECLMIAEGPPDTVTEVIEVGYELQGLVLRPAKVKVGTPTVPTSPPAPSPTSGEVEEALGS